MHAVYSEYSERNRTIVYIRDTENNPADRMYLWDFHYDHDEFAVGFKKMK